MADAMELPSLEKLPSLAGIDRHDPTLKDEDYRPHTWGELKELVGSNSLGMLRRWPSERRAYMQWSADIREEYGTVMDYIIQVRLKWTIARDSVETGTLFEVSSPVPFQSAKDWKILPNDWPYGFVPGIVHLIVWLKHRLEVEPTKGDLTPRSRAQVRSFIQRRFGEEVSTLSDSRDRIVWFKNWTALQTVPGIDHIHVLVRDVPKDMVQSWINS